MAHRDFLREVAGGRDVAHDAGDGGERMRDGPRDGEAENRREQDGQHGGDGETLMNGFERS